MEVTELSVSKYPDVTPFDASKVYGLFGAIKLHEDEVSQMGHCILPKMRCIVFTLYYLV
jgi:hypothetical protein